MSILPCIMYNVGQTFSAWDLRRNMLSNSSSAAFSLSSSFTGLNTWYCNEKYFVIKSFEFTYYYYLQFVNIEFVSQQHSGFQTLQLQSSSKTYD